MTRTVVHVTDTAGFGGAEQMLLTLLAALDRERWRCVLVHDARAGAAQVAAEARRLGIRTLAVPATTRFGRAGALAAMLRTLRAERPAIVHAHLIGALHCSRGLVAARLAGVPAIVATQQLYPQALPSRMQRRQRLIARLVDRYVAVSDAMASAMREAAPGARITVVRNAVVAERFRNVSDAAIAATGIGDLQRPVVLAIARLHRQKGLTYLLDAAAELPEATFVIAGEGPERGRLEARARALNLGARVRFLGHRNDVAELLGACDVFVLPSLYEGLPVTTLEAMAAGRPVVATAIGGTDEAVVDGETGLLVPPADAAALAAAVRRLLGDRVLAARLAAAGRARVEHFSAAAMAEQISQLYGDLLRAPAPHAAPAAARDADWRFLLPTPPGGTFRHLVLLGGSPALADRLRVLGVAREVSRELPRVPIADAVVRLEGAGPDLGTAARALAAGGVLYAEFGGKHATPFRIRRVLRSEGLIAERLYWCTPGFADHAAYVPLESPAAMRWYFRNLASGTVARRAAGIALGVMASLGEAIYAPALRRYAVTAIRSPGGAGRPSLLGNVDLPAPLAGADLDLLLLAPGNRRVVLLPFARGGAHPAAAIKLTREPSHNARAISEQTALATLQGRTDGPLRHAIPKPLGHLEWGGLVASVESGVAGTLLVKSRTATSPRRRVEVLRTVAQWLTQLECETESARVPWGRSAFCASLASATVRHCARFGAGADVGLLLSEVERRSSELAALPLPVVCTHGDLHPANISWNGTLAGVLDWVDAGEGPPLVDLFRFIAEWGAHVDAARGDAEWLRSFRRLLAAPPVGSLALAARREVAASAAALGVAAPLTPLLLAGTWLTRAAHHAHEAERAGSATHRRLASRYAGCVAAFAADPSTLFAWEMGA